MHVTIRRYRNWLGPAGEVARRARETLVPTLRDLPGFRLYCAFESEDGDALSLNIAEDRRQAIAPNAQILQWVRTEAADVLPHLPEVITGDCWVCTARHLLAQAGGPLYVTIRQHYGLGPEDSVMPLVRDHVLPLVVRAPGFRAFFAFMNAQHPGQGVGVTLFDSREHAARSNERAIAAVLERGIAPHPPKITAGEALVMQAAEAAWPELTEGPAT
jgi:hypothetical protein